MRKMLHFGLEFCAAMREQDALDAVEIEHALVLQQVAVADGHDVASDVVSWRVVGNGGHACK